MFKIFSSVFLLFFFSLGSQAQPASKVNYDKSLLIGNWHRMMDADTEQMTTSRGFAFSQDSLEIFEGIFRKDSSRYFRQNEYFYQGNFLKYQIRNDSIFTFDTLLDTWILKDKILLLSKDTLTILKGGVSRVSYYKIDYPIWEDVEFDQISIYTTSCFGSCPVMGITLYNDGRYFIQGEAYTQDTGLVRGKLNKYKTDFIFEKFRRVNFKDLNRRYNASYTDDATYTTTLINAGKIEQSVTVYGYSGPKELEWAFVPLKNLFTSTDLKPETLADSFSVFPPLISFKTDKDVLQLLRSESFFLWMELYNKPTSSKVFEATYEVHFSYDPSFPEEFFYWNTQKTNTKVISVQTDGRYFRFHLSNGQSSTHDLGYNFIDRNFEKTDFKRID